MTEHDQAPDGAGGDFREYRRLILAHMESSTARQSALEDSLLELRVQLGVLVVKVSLIVAMGALAAGAIVTLAVRNATTPAAIEAAP